MAPVSSPWWRNQKVLDSFKKPTAVNKAKIKMLLGITDWRSGNLDDMVCYAIMRYVTFNRKYTTILYTENAKRSLEGLGLPHMVETKEDESYIHIQPTQEQRDALQDLITGRYKKHLEEKRLQHLRLIGWIPQSDITPPHFDAVKDATKRIKDSMKLGVSTSPKAKRPMEAAFRHLPQLSTDQATDQDAPTPLPSPLSPSETT